MSKRLRNYLLVIIFVVSIKHKVVNKQIKIEKEKLKKDLDFYLDYYKEVAARSEKIREEFDREIERIVEALKQIGK